MKDESDSGQDFFRHMRKMIEREELAKSRMARFSGHMLNAYEKPMLASLFLYAAVLVSSWVNIGYQFPATVGLLALSVWNCGHTLVAIVMMRGRLECYVYVDSFLPFNAIRIMLISCQLICITYATTIAFSAKNAPSHSPVLFTLFVVGAVFFHLVNWQHALSVKAYYTDDRIE